MTTISLLRLLPNLLSLNGSLGNAEVLATRLRWWGMSVDIQDANPGDTLPAKRPDIVVLGHGTSSTLAPAAAALAKWSVALRSVVEDGAVVCGFGLGGDLLGESVSDLEGQGHAGLGITDGRADLAGARASTEVAGEDYLGREVAGYLNDATIRQHTSFRPMVRLASPVPPTWRGVTGEQGEGIVAERVWATALSGPVLSLNPQIADDIITRILEGAGQGVPEPTDLHRLVDQAAARARQRIRARLGLS